MAQYLTYVLVRNSNPQLKCSYRYNFIVHPEILVRSTSSLSGIPNRLALLVSSKVLPIMLKNSPNMLALCFMLFNPYYAENYAGIIDAGLIRI